MKLLPFEKMVILCGAVLGDLFSVKTMEVLKIHTVWANNYFSALAALKEAKDSNPK